ncbi:MAG: hypothetical protein SCJ97_03080 [Bacillota bacterium]|nr:hypothetical protein [Bacillota bacterium]
MSKDSSQSISNEAVIEATGRSWDDWLARLKEIKAENLTHKDIVKILETEYKVDSWWAQTITVEFERITGRRKVGQTGAGYFQVSASRTLTGSMDQVFGQWLSFIDGIKKFNNLSMIGNPRISETEKWRYWRVNLSDGSQLAVSVNNKAKGKSLLTVTHSKLPDEESSETWKKYWKDFIQKVPAD